MTATTENNKRIVLEYFENVFNNQKFDYISKLLSKNYKYNGVPSSIEQNKAWVISLHQKYPGLHFSIECILAEHDMVALRWRMDAPAFGDRPEGYVTGTNILTLADGQALTNDQNGTLSPSWSTTT